MDTDLLKWIENLPAHAWEFYPDFHKVVDVNTGRMVIVNPKNNTIYLFASPEDTQPVKETFDESTADKLQALAGFAGLCKILSANKILMKNNQVVLPGSGIVTISPDGLKFEHSFNPANNF